MQWFVTHQMRLLAILFIAVVSITIILSYTLIPTTTAVSLADFYRQYWQVLTRLFVIAAVFMILAYSVEQSWLRITWTQRAAALVLIAGFVAESIQLIQIAELFAIIAS